MFRATKDVRIFTARDAPQAWTEFATGSFEDRLASNQDGCQLERLEFEKSGGDPVSLTLVTHIKVVLESYYDKGASLLNMEVFAARFGSNL